MFQNLVGRQFEEVGCTHNSKKADIELNKNNKMHQSRLMKLIFLVQAHCVIVLVHRLSSTAANEGFRRPWRKCVAFH